jgi:tetratricopeptide (TPR) repeat protein
VADSPRIEELKRRVHSDPASIAFAALAEEYRRAGRFEDAIETCTAGLIRHPSYLSAHVTLGRALIEVGRLEDARNELEYVLRLAPENLAAIRGLAEIHDRLGEGSHEPAAKSQPHEPAAPAMTVAEIHAASGFIQPAAQNTEPALSFAPAEAFTPPVTFPWEAQPAAPPAPPSFDSAQDRSFDSGGTTARPELAPWEAEPAASPVPPEWEAEAATTPAEPFAPSIQPALEAEPAPSYFVISVEEAEAPEAPPALASLSQVEQTPDEPPPVSFDPSTSSGSSRAKSRDDSAQDRPFDSAHRTTGLEDFLNAILRARAQRDALR